MKVVKCFLVKEKGEELDIQNLSHIAMRQNES